jgi:hypothetical protein
MRLGLTTRSHHEHEEPEVEYFVPSPDLADSNDDGWVKKFSLPSGKQRRMKKFKKSNWYDESKSDAHEQFAIKLCFKDVYQLEVALRNFHIAQLRNLSYHTNNLDSIIVEYSEKAQDCPFYMTILHDCI